MDTQNKYEFINENENIIVIKDETHPLYVVKGENNFLIDAGLTAKAKKYREGLAAALQGDKIDTLLLTHSHYDHVGAASYLQDIYHFNIFGSDETIEMLKNPDLIEMIDFQNRELMELYGDSSNIKCEMLKNLERVAEGGEIELSSDRYLEVISSPGHSFCSQSYLLYPDMVLFPGDSAGMMEKNGKKRPVFFTGYKDYEKTLQKFAEIEPEAVAFSHALYIKGKDKVKKYFNDSLGEARKLKEEILSGLMKSLPEMKIAEEIALRGFTPDSVMGKREYNAMYIATMVKTIKREFLATNYR